MDLWIFLGDLEFTLKNQVRKRENYQLYQERKKERKGKKETK